ncbi:MAG TPA: zf-HC2 domain-containing protein [Chthonomonadaceae bacterium]|nr:zf-HC2 domain-containing protein [Chthonomonadaceae bacterium]
MWGYNECRSVADLLWSYTAHRLSEQDVERVERHLAGCESCRAEAAAYRQTVDALAAIRRSPAPESRRGWHELRGRLAEAEGRRAFPIPALRIPAFAWSLGAVAAAGLLLVLTPAGNLFRPQPAAVVTGIASPPPAAAHEPAPQDGLLASDAGSQIDPDELRAFVQDGDSQNVHAASATVAARAPRHMVRRPTRIALSESYGERRRFAAGTTHGRGSRRLDYSGVDGARASGGADSTDYVLTPVSAESDAPATYVMGSVVMTGRSADAEEARGW